MTENSKNNTKCCELIYVLLMKNIAINKTYYDEINNLRILCAQKRSGI